MRHRVAHRKLGRVTEHRIALLRSQAQALLRHERIETTLPKAKELRPFVERIITVAKRSLTAGKGTMQDVNARRAVARDIADAEVVSKLFESIAPRYESRPGGYTRILKVGFRRGDGADLAQIELLGSEYNPALDAETPETAATAGKKTVGSRLRAAATRLRGGKAKADAADRKEEAREEKPSRPRARKKTEKAETTEE
jgi:large subunit ribosomal protein L17